MSMVINHNLMATRTANALNQAYGSLATSTQRLSTGLRINSAADDAAGLAIRELQRADIAALHQGARNANDAVSMIQVADGALGVIDEKLIRMKELAEQAATGTYDSTQRLMIESEYQQMASEITRIANATDFNGVHLLDGSLAGAHDGSKLNAEGKMKVHFGTGNDSAEDYYYIEIGEATAEAFSLGSASTWEEARDRLVTSFGNTYRAQVTKEYEADPQGKNNTNIKTQFQKIDAVIEDFEANLKKVTEFETAVDFNRVRNLWFGGGFLEDGKVNNYSFPEEFKADMTLADFEKLSARDQQKIKYAFGKAAMYNFVNSTPPRFGMTGVVDLANDATNVNLDARKLALGQAYTDSQRYDYAGMTIQTQEDAQIALNAINDAIVQKDNIRAHLGAMQNRLENTITNLNTQAENLQAAESRISDVDIATEMTQFVRNQILTQAATAMLSQANSLPQMAMQLIGG